MIATSNIASSANKSKDSLVML